MDLGIFIADDEAGHAILQRMVDRANQPEDTLPQIELRVPGPWGSPIEFEDALQQCGAPFRIEEGALVETESGRSFEVGTSPPDDEIAQIFAQDRRISKAEVDAIASHQVKIHVLGPGGSIPAARAIMQAATALVRAGGFGVMVDNSGNTHAPR